jgi:uncharacterized SAM-binding protein YcdF (DUF218 family)
MNPRTTENDQRATPVPKPRARIRLLWWILGAGCVLVALLVLTFFQIGKWLVVDDSLAASDVIVIINGQMPERALEAAQLFQAKFAPQVWITRSAEDPTDEMQKMGIAYLGEAFYDQKILIQKGVTPEAIRVLDQPTYNTQDEIAKISAVARAEALHHIIIVTSKAHTRRVRLIWKKLVGGDPALIVRYASGDRYDGAHWWRHTQDALDVLRETMGLANAWTGFPLHHRPVTPATPGNN